MSDALVDLALRTARTPAAGLDVQRHLREVCDDVVRLLGVPAAVIVVLDPFAAHASDELALILGEAQRGASVGPVANAVRSRRPMLVPDLVRVGPPALAAAADGCGLTSSGVTPLCVDDRVVGALHLLGTRDRPVDAAHLDRFGPLPAVLAAKLVDVAALARPAESSARPVDVMSPTEVMERARRPAAPRSAAPAATTVDDTPETTQLAVVPTPRRRLLNLPQPPHPSQARHRRAE